MSFYFSLYQIIEGVERLVKDVQHLASRALRISPRDARTNRELLETCETKLTEVRNILTQKSHISKVTLRKAALLFQLLDVQYRRVVHLAAATDAVGPEEEEAIRHVWRMLNLAQRHYRLLLQNVDGLTGIPASMALGGGAEVSASGFAAVVSRESDYQAEALKLLDKAVEVLDEEEGLTDKLAVMRKELIEEKRVLRSWSGRTVSPVERVPADATSPAYSGAKPL